VTKKKYQGKKSSKSNEYARGKNAKQKIEKTALTKQTIKRMQVKRRKRVN
jgi:hypothetical protein